MDEETKGETKPRRTRRRLRWGRLIILLLTLAALSAAIFKSSVWVYNTFINPPQARVAAPSDRIRDDEKLNERINVLLLGIDDGDSEAAEYEPKRTDAIILASFDPERDRVSVLSIPRDTKVVLPGHRDAAKINAAYAYGGAVMAKQTVANLLEVPIHYYVLADWRAFIDMVDLIGGVDIFVENDMRYEDPYADLVIDIKKGYQHMDGVTAGKYVRFRSDELGDIGRVQRQQKFLRSAAEQLLSLGNLGKIGTLLSTIDKYVETDLNTAIVLKAANSFKIFGKDKIKSCMLYGKFDDSEGISFWSADKEAVNRTLDELEIPRLKQEVQTEEQKAAEKVGIR